MRWWVSLVALMLVAGWATSCPESCSCHNEHGLYIANCSALPYSGGKIEVLNLLPTRDTPLELSDGQFNQARHLKYLNLRNTSIYFVHKKAFYGAKSVIEIDISFNHIEKLEPTVFQHLTSLKTLILRGNPIHFVSEVPFLISNSLQHLDIGQCGIRSVPRGVFYGLKRLKYLSMDGNFLKSLNYNSLPKGLKYLNLSQNLIVDVPTDVLSALSNLRRIGLSGNPINCTCSLMTFQDWFSGRGVIFEDGVICDLPFEYHGISWSKVDENKLCFAEARREEMIHSSMPLYKNRLYAENYLENENGYLGENVQGDQPDSQAEVLFQNEETAAMGEMMRDEEQTKQLNEKEQSELNKETDIQTDVEDDTISQTPAIESKELTEESKDIGTNIDNQNLEVESKDIGPEVTGQNVEKEPEIKNEEKNIDKQNPEEKSQETKNEKVDSSIPSETTNLLINGSAEIADINMQDLDSNGDKVEEDDQYIEPITSGKPENNVEIIDSVNSSSSSAIEKLSPLTEEKHNKESVATDESSPSLDTAPLVNLNASGAVEYKSLNEEDSNTEVDDIKREGFFHVESANIKVNENDTMEESTANPDIEETTEGEVPTQDPTINISISEENTKSEENVSEATPLPTESPPLISSEVPKLTKLHPPISETRPDITESYNESTTSNSPISKEDKIKQVAGAEVVMFCIAILIICLILFSIYKCRRSSKRQSMRIPKDMEANRGTEMQDLASLLPKPQDDEKNNKYPDKPPSSETMKLIPEPNENESSNFTPVADKTKIETKNSLNNNTPPSPTSKTPLIKPGNAVTINPAAPIQRTKVKVGIIPDSIPRTPIFLQKAYNNGTKHV